jgi:hypothetical protein
METLIKEAAGLVGSLGMYVRLIIVGVWFPGFLIFSEIGSTYFALYGPSDQELFGYIAEKIRTFDSDVVTTFIIVFVLATSITAGYVARDIAFAISDLWLRRRWRPTRELTDIYDQIRRVYGVDRVEEVTSKYDVFRLARGEADGLSLPRTAASYVREYCKQWLRLRAPDLNTEGLEIEINMVMGLVIPVALSAIVFAFFIEGWLGPAMAVLSVAAAGLLMYRISWARDIETERALVNFLFAHWENVPAAGALPCTDAGEHQQH